MLAKYINRFFLIWLLPLACLCAGTGYWLLTGSANGNQGQGAANAAKNSRALAGSSVNAATERYAASRENTLSDTAFARAASSSATSEWSHLTEANETGFARSAAATNAVKNFNNEAAYRYEDTPVLAMYDDGAVEVAIPVAFNRGGERHAAIPVALALAADPLGLPQSMRDAVQDMAKEFLADIAPAAAGSDPSSAAYFSRWQAAARKSDQEFKMRYGKVAFIRMNLLTAQEAAASAR